MTSGVLDRRARRILMMCASVLLAWVCATGAASAAVHRHAAHRARPEIRAHRLRPAAVRAASRLALVRFATGRARHARAVRARALAARAAGPQASCTTSWASATSGNWNTTANWTNGVPSATCAASITVAGTYTVTISGTSDSADGLTLGAGSGKQTLAVDATDNCSGAANGTLTLPAGGTVTAAGRIELTQTTTGNCGEGTPELEVTGGTLANAGAIEDDLGPDQTNGSYPPYLDGSIVNTGTITLNETTNLGAGISNSALDNKGTLTVSSGDDLNTSNSASINEDTGGSITNAGGTGAVVMSGGSYDQGAGTTSPATVNPADPAVILNSTALDYTGTGSSSVVFRGGAALSGNIASGQDLTIQATDFCSGAANAQATAGASFTNAGDIELSQTTNSGNCGHGTPLLEQTAGTLTNSGTIETDLGSAQTNGAYPADIDGVIVNTGAININEDTNLGSDISNSSIDDKGTLTLSGTTNSTLNTTNAATVTDDTGGTITNQGGTGGLVMNGGTYNQGAGTTNLATTVDPSDPAVLLNSTALNYTGAGASSIVFRGGASLSGSLGSAQDLAIQATDFCSGAANATATVSASLTNAGDIDLTQAGGCPEGTPLLEVDSPATLTNSGTLQTQLGPDQTNGNYPAYLDGAFTNTGTITIAQDSYLGNAIGDSSLNNEGALALMNASNLTTENSATVTDGTGGTITNGGVGGSVVVNGGKYTQGAGTTSPATLDPSDPAVLLNSAALSYTGTGASSVVFRGTAALSGSLAATQSLAIQATDFCSGAANAQANAASSFTNAGAIELTQTGGCGEGTPLLEVDSPATLTNSGTIGTVPGSNQTNGQYPAYLDGAITNTGSITIGETSYFGNGIGDSSLDNKGTLTLDTADTLNTENSATVTDDTGGLISNGSGTGELVVNGGTYTQGSGKISQTTPVPTDPAVLLQSAALKYTGKGTGTIVARDGTTETGNLVKNQNLDMQSTDFCNGASSAELSPTKKITSAGIISLSHTGGCSQGTADISLGNSITLTNKGTIAGLSGTLAIQGGTLSNSGTLSVAAGETLPVSSTLKNVSSAGVLKGGTYTLSGTLQYQNNAFITKGITNNDATITLDGAGAFTDANGDNALRNLATNAKKLTLSGGDSLSTSVGLTNTGAISLGGGSTLGVGGAFTQSGSKSTLTIFLASATSNGDLTATGAASLAGTLVIDQTYDAAASTSESVLSSTGLTDTAKVSIKNTGGKGSATPVVTPTATGITVTG